MKKSALHTCYFMGDDGFYRSLPPHRPGKCWGQDGDPCPPKPDEPCEHKHRTAAGANTCSRNREPFA